MGLESVVGDLIRRPGSWLSRWRTAGQWLFLTARESMNSFLNDMENMRMFYLSLVLQTQAK